MKIAVIGCKGLPASESGVERHIEELYSRLADMGHEITVYCRPHYCPDDNPEIYKHMKLTLKRSFNTKHLDAISHTFVCSLDTLASNFDIIHFHGIGPAILSWLPRLKRRARIFVTIHALDWQRDKWGTGARWFLKAGERASLTFPHKTIAVSKLIAEYCREKYHKDVVYIPNGVNPGIARQADMISKKFGLAANGYFFFAARLVPEKGCHDLIAAFSAINTNLKLAIAGDSSHSDSYAADLKESAKTDPRIIFTGRIDGPLLQELFSNAYAFVLPSTLEGLPIALLEALSYGKPVICSDIGPNIEIIGKDQSFGITFKARDAVDLRRSLTYAMEHKTVMGELAKKGREFVLDAYNWDTVAALTGRLYEGGPDGTDEIFQPRLAAINDALKDNPLSK